MLLSTVFLQQNDTSFKKLFYVDYSDELERQKIVYDAICNLSELNESKEGGRVVWLETYGRILASDFNSKSIDELIKYHEESSFDSELIYYLMAISRQRVFEPILLEGEKKIPKPQWFKWSMIKARFGNVESIEKYVTRISISLKDDIDGKPHHSRKALEDIKTLQRLKCDECVRIIIDLLNKRDFGGEYGSELCFYTRFPIQDVAANTLGTLVKDIPSELATGTYVRNQQRVEALIEWFKENPDFQILR